MLGLRFGALQAAPLLEEVLQHGTTGIGQHAAHHGGLVVELRLGKQVDDRTHRAGAGLRGTKHHPLQAGVQHGTTAHGAGLQRDKQLTTVQPVVAQHLRGRTQRNDFGMGGGVVAGEGGVAAGGDDHAVLHHHRAHRHFTRSCSRVGQRQRLCHKNCVGTHLLLIQELSAHAGWALDANFVHIFDPGGLVLLVVRQGPGLLHGRLQRLFVLLLDLLALFAHRSRGGRH